MPRRVLTRVLSTGEEVGRGSRCVVVKNLLGPFADRIDGIVLCCPHRVRSVRRPSRTARAVVSTSSRFFRACFGAAASLTALRRGGVRGGCPPRHPPFAHRGNWCGHPWGHSRGRRPPFWLVVFARRPLLDTAFWSGAVACGRLCCGGGAGGGRIPPFAPRDERSPPRAVAPAAAVHRSVRRFCAAPDSRRSTLVGAAWCDRRSSPGGMRGGCPPPAIRPSRTTTAGPPLAWPLAAGARGDGSAAGPEVKVADGDDGGGDEGGGRRRGGGRGRGGRGGRGEGRRGRGLGARPRPPWTRPQGDVAATAVGSTAAVQGSLPSPRSTPFRSRGDGRRRRPTWPSLSPRPCGCGCGGEGEKGGGFGCGYGLGHACGCGCGHGSTAPCQRRRAAKSRGKRPGRRPGGDGVAAVAVGDVATFATAARGPLPSPWSSPVAVR